MTGDALGLKFPATVDYVYDNRAIVGDPDYCIAKIEELKRHGVRYLGANFAMGGLDHGKVLKSMELFATRGDARGWRARSGGGRI